MQESRYRSFDLTIKGLAAIVGIGGALIGLWRYFDTAEKDFRKPLWERQIALYFDASRAAATIATTTDSTVRSEAEAAFWELYWGPLSVVEDSKVERAMVDFGNCLRGEEEGSLRQLSLDLAHACRKSLGESWDVRFDELKGKEQQGPGQ